MNGIPSSTYFSAPPDWGWLIVFYFFFGGLAGGCYFLAALIDLVGRPEDRPLARLGYYIAFPCVLLSALLLDSRSHSTAALLAYADRVEHFSADVQVLVSDVGWLVGAFDLRRILLAIFSRSARRGQSSRTGRPGANFARRDCLAQSIAVIGGLLGFFVAGYTGVLLAVTNRPIWSDTPLLGHAVYRFGRIDIGGVDDSAGAKIEMDHARFGGLAPHRRVGDRVGIYRLDRRDDIARTGLARMAERVGRVAVFRCHRGWHVDSLGALLAQARLGDRNMTTAAALVLLGGFILRLVIVFSAQGV